MNGKEVWSDFRYCNLQFLHFFRTNLNEWNRHLYDDYVTHQWRLRWWFTFGRERVKMRASGLGTFPCADLETILVRDICVFLVDFSLFVHLASDSKLPSSISSKLCVKETIVLAVFILLATNCVVSSRSFLVLFNYFVAKQSHFCTIYHL